MGVSLFEHNRTAYEAAAAMLAQEGRAAVVHPTGTGKSFIAFQLCRDNPDRRVCWLAPSGYIFRTQRESWLKAGGEDLPNITFLTYAKLSLTDREEIRALRPDYIILDEFHRCGAQVWGQGVKRLLRMYPDAPVLGLSATNIRYLDDQRDMADELFGGNIASEMTLGEAVVRGILNPPRYITALYSCRKDLEKYQERVRKLKDGKRRDEAERYLEALRRSLEKADGLDTIFGRHMAGKRGKYIVFCANAAHMREMMAQAEDWFAKVDPKPRRYSVYSEDPSSSESFATFKEDNDAGHLRLLYCIDALNEGIHVEGIDGVILLRPTVSPIVYRQQIGRALSAGQAGEPVIFDIVNNIAGLYSIAYVEDEMEEAVKYYEFLGEGQNIVNEHFRIIDEVRDCRDLFDRLEGLLSASWEEMYAEAEKRYRLRGDLDAACAEEPRLARWLSRQRRSYRDGQLEPERKRRLDVIGMRWESMTERAWARCYQAAEQYYRENGDLDVHADYETKEGLKLGVWIAGQRYHGRRGDLTEEQMQMLDGIGMSWHPYIKQWERGCEHAEDYCREHGSLNPAADYVAGDGFALGKWLNTQRRKYKTGKLSKERIERLEHLHITWSPSDILWQEGYRHAAQYREENGHLNVPNGYICGDGYQLGVWITNQRTRHKSGKMPEERQKLLEELGMVWDVFASRWQEGYAHAEEYYAKHGDIRVPKNYVCRDGYRLDSWITAQSRAYRDGGMTAERAERLERIGIS